MKSRAPEASRMSVPRARQDRRPTRKLHQAAENRVRLQSAEVRSSARSEATDRRAFNRKRGAPGKGFRVSAQLPLSRPSPSPHASEEAVVSFTTGDLERETQDSAMAALKVGASKRRKTPGRRAFLEARKFVRVLKLTLKARNLKPCSVRLC